MKKIITILSLICALTAHVELDAMGAPGGSPMGAPGGSGGGLGLPSAPGGTDSDLGLPSTVTEQQMTATNTLVSKLNSTLGGPGTTNPSSLGLGGGSSGFGFNN